MLKNSKAFSGFSVNNLQEAKKFYGETLGIEVAPVPGMDEYLISLKTAGCDFMVYAKENHQPATFTVLNFPVKDIEKTVQELKSRGVQFEKYTEEPIKTDENNISRNGGMAIAWFKDPAGNIHSVIEEN